MKKLQLRLPLLLLPIALLAACTSVPSAYDMRFGDTVRDANSKMTINPNAGKNPNQLAGIDGKAAKEIIIRYQDSYKTPPPVVNVINIGGNISGGGGGGN